jgi:methylglyoxal synthase
MTKRIALVAHDHMKPALLAWVNKHAANLKQHSIVATGTTGQLIGDLLQHEVHCFESGPLGGDQQIGAKICEGEIDIMVFFWDPLEAQPHDPDVKALLRLATVWNIPVAYNESTAEFLISSPMFNAEHSIQRPDFSNYRARTLKK